MVLFTIKIRIEEERGVHSGLSIYSLNKILGLRHDGTMSQSSKFSHKETNFVVRSSLGMVLDKPVPNPPWIIKINPVYRISATTNNNRVFISADSFKAFQFKNKRWALFSHFNTLSGHVCTNSNEGMIMRNAWLEAAAKIGVTSSFASGKSFSKFLESEKGLEFFREFGAICQASILPLLQNVTVGGYRKSVRGLGSLYSLSKKSTTSKLAYWRTGRVKSTRQEFPANMIGRT